MPATNQFSSTRTTQVTGIRLRPIDLDGAGAALTAPVPGRLIASTPDKFFVRGTHLDLRTAAVAFIRIAPCRYTQRRGMPDVIEATYVVNGTVEVHCSGGTRSVSAGGLVFSRPLSGDVLEVTITSKLYRAYLPASAFNSGVLEANDLPLIMPVASLARPFSAMLAGIIAGADGEVGPIPCAALERALVGVAQAILVGALATRPGAATSSLRDRAVEYINLRYADRALNPSEIAAALGISVRSLHLAFEGQGLSVARQIRVHRLRAVTGSLRAGERPRIADLARDHGFSGADQLTRSFRVEFGRSLNSYRTG